MKISRILCAVCAYLFLSSQVNATSISLGGAADFAVLALDNSSMFTGNDATTIGTPVINDGNVGIGPNSDADLTLMAIDSPPRSMKNAVNELFLTG